MEGYPSDYIGSWLGGVLSLIQPMYLYSMANLSIGF